VKLNLSAAKLSISTLLIMVFLLSMVSPTMAVQLPTRVSLNKTTISAVANPTASGLLKKLTIEKGKSANLSGTITCSSGLEKISICVDNYYGATDGIIYTRTVSGNSYNLSNISINSNHAAFAKAGTYNLEIWAKAIGGTGQKLGNLTLTVTSATVQPAVPAPITVKPVPSPVKPVSPASINLNKNSISLTVGSSETLKATVLPTNAANKAVTWSSSKTSVAKVSNGKITGVAPGTATIKVKTADGNKAANCIVIVKAATIKPTVPAPITVKPVTAVANPTASGLPKKLTVEKGKSVNLSGMVKCSSGLEKISICVDNYYGATDGVINTRTVSGNSYNLSNITINSNHAAFTKTGTYNLEIWAKAIGGTGQKLGSLTLTVTSPKITPIIPAPITVKPVPVPVKPVPAASISLNKNTTSLIVGSSETLSATVLPTNTANNKAVTWTSSNSSIAKVANGTITGVAPGTATITVKTVDGNKTAKCIVIVKASTVQLAIPVITEPTNNSSRDLGDIIVKWNPVKGASKYKIAVADITDLVDLDKDGVKVLKPTEVVGGATNYTVLQSVFKAGHKYRIGIAAVGADGKEGKWGTAIITIKTLLSPYITEPKNNSTLDMGDVVVKWNPVKGASKYRIAVADISNLVNENQDGVKVLKPTDVSAGTTSYTIPKSILENGWRYRVGVVAIGADGTEGKWSTRIVAFKSKIKPFINVENPKYNQEDNSITLKAVVSKEIFLQTKEYPWIAVRIFDGSKPILGSLSKNVVTLLPPAGKEHDKNSNIYSATISKTNNPVAFNILQKLRGKELSYVFMADNYIWTTKINTDPFYCKSLTIPIRSFSKIYNPQYDSNSDTLTLKAEANKGIYQTDEKAYPWIAVRVFDGSTKVLGEENIKVMTLGPTNGTGSKDSNTFSVAIKPDYWAYPLLPRGKELTFVFMDDHYTWRTNNINPDDFYNIKFTIPDNDLVISSTLVYGSKNNEVEKLQRKLTALGLDVSGDDIGYFGRNTLSAIVALQIHENSLTKDGKVGSTTCSRINSLIRNGRNDKLRNELMAIQNNILVSQTKDIVLKSGGNNPIDGVKYLQAILNGYFKLDIGNAGVDGKFGTTTSNAVKAIQKYKGLTIDGKVGSTQTWPAVYDLLLKNTDNLRSTLKLNQQAFTPVNQTPVTKTPGSSNPLPAVVIPESVAGRNVTGLINVERNLLNNLKDQGFGANVKDIELLSQRLTQGLPQTSNGYVVPYTDQVKLKQADVLMRAFTAHNYMGTASSHVEELAKMSGGSFDALLKNLLSNLLEIRSYKAYASYIPGGKSTLDKAENSLVMIIKKYRDKLVGTIGGRGLAVDELIDKILNTGVGYDIDQGTKLINTAFDSRRGIVGDVMYKSYFTPSYANELQVINNYTKSYGIENINKPLPGNYESAELAARNTFFNEQDKYIKNFNKVNAMKTVGEIADDFKSVMDKVGIPASLIPKQAQAAAKVGAKALLITDKAGKISEAVGNTSYFTALQLGISSINDTINNIRLIPRQAFSQP